MILQRTIEAAPILFRMLGFSPSQLSAVHLLEIKPEDTTQRDIDTTIKTAYAPALLKDIDTFWVYSDIVAESLVGNQEAKLLGIISVQHLSNANKNGTVRVHYDKPHYLPLSRSTISTIEIKIYDTYGRRPVQFKNDVIIQLHFRLKSNK